MNNVIIINFTNSYPFVIVVRLDNLISSRIDLNIAMIMPVTIYNDCITLDQLLNNIIIKNIILILKRLL